MGQSNPWTTLRQPPEMCGLRTRPRTDVDPPRFLPPTVELPSAWGGGISSRRPRGDNLLSVLAIEFRQRLSTSVHTTVQSPFTQRITMQTHRNCLQLSTLLTRLQHQGLVDILRLRFLFRLISSIANYYLCM